MYRDQSMNLKQKTKNKNRIFESVCVFLNQFTTTSNFNKLSLTYVIGDYKDFKWASS